MIRKSCLLMTLAAIISFSARAWVYPEHRDIMVRAVQKLDPGRRALLDQLWQSARKGYEERLDPAVADATQGLAPKTLDYAAWPAIAGDHSTSAVDMLHNILQTDWILNVAGVAARLKYGIANAHSESERVAQLRDSDLRFLRADPQYVTRAGSNNVHFMLARTNVNVTYEAYFDSCYRAGTEMNLVGTYLWYHTSALEKAGWINDLSLTPEQRSALVIAALADEAFALHFLEDAFSAGHVAGIRGNAALRKGTHDYYDEYGLEVTTWQGERMVLTGDAYIRPVDIERASVTVIASLNQFLDAVSGSAGRRSAYPADMALTPDTFNVAMAMHMPSRTIGKSVGPMSDSILVTTPVPGLSSGLGEIPRFRSEIGPFIGVQPAVRASFVSGGFSPSQMTIGVIPGLEVALHVGLGLDGVLGETSDGLVFLDLGYRLDGASTIKLESDPGYKYFGSILSAVPSREAFYLRLRLPYYVVPGDLIILAPILYLVAPKAMSNVVATAGAGGLVPWQKGLVTSFGRFQFILGREVGICFYGSLQGADSYLMPAKSSTDGTLILLSMRTTQLDFPIIEYRPLRTFSRRQSASLLIQLGAGVDIPGKVTMLVPDGGTAPHLKPIWSVGLRAAFDWRYYYARKRK
jgi:hypothetical protein